MKYVPIISGVMMLFLTFTLLFAGGEKYSQDRYLKNLVALSGVANDELSAQFLLTDEAPLIDSVGLFIVGSDFRVVSNDQSTGWLCVIEKRHSIKSKTNGERKFWVYEISHHKIFEK